MNIIRVFPKKTSYTPTDEKNIKDQLKDTNETMHHLTHPKTMAERYFNWFEKKGEFAEVQQ